MTNQATLTSSDTVWHQATVSRTHRELKNGHRAVILWFTGLSGAGKSTLAHAVEEQLNIHGANTYVLDGDNVRHGLCGDLGFSDADRQENIRRIAHMSKLFIDAGIISLNAFISPFESDRQHAREMVADGDFIEIFCKASVNECEARDVKGLYKKARNGEIKNFTGISSPYEEPKNPELVIETGSERIEHCAKQVIQHLLKKAILPYSRGMAA